MAEIASFFLSPLLQVFYEKVVFGEFVGFFRQQKLSDGLLKKLKTTLLTLNAVFEDAEELQVSQKPDVKEWLDELKDAIYDAEDVLDEIATEALLSELDAEFQAPASKVRKLSSSSSRNSSVKEIELKIKEVLERLETLAQQIDLLGLRVGVGGKLSERLPTTSLVEESDICGRSDEKEAIIKMLLSDDACGNEMGVIAIVGMGGIGKTTLAQLLYNDDRVKKSFDHLAWVCVLEDFNLFKITKTIVERVSTSSTSNDENDLDKLQRELKEKLMGKKFLFILDDVWNETDDHWETLCKPFKYGAQGSKVIVTTRSDRVVSIARAMSYRLMELPEEDCLSLFAKHAFHDGNSNAHGELEVTGRKIIEKCRGLPLAVKTISALLSKSDVDEWDNILKSELWDLPIDDIGIFPALRLSYKYLPSHLKRCFAYCSIFPKGYLFKKHELVLLWIAEGFLHESRNKTIEEVGDDCFFALVSRSLFQQSNDNKSLFIMHDLVNDLATFVSGQFNVRMEGDYSKEIVNKVRHLSYVQEEFDSFKKFEALYKANKLCTFLPIDLTRSYFSYLTKKVPHQLLPMLKCLRVLSLSLYRNMTELPDSIGELKHLRYLDLSSTEVQRLPDSICKLCNLQTLLLSNCESLAALPRDTWKLVSLRHLDITKTNIEEMPVHLGRLKCLQTLTKFIVGKDSGFCIGELGKLVNLRGSLSIAELQNVESADALEPSLRDKKYLEELVLEWKYDNSFSESQRIVLDSLRPPTNLKSLAIEYYGGRSFSDWVGHPSFSKLASLHLQNCKYCTSLPPLGQLPSLQNLSIVGFDEVVTVGQEFCGSGSSSFKPFAALKVLTLNEMPKWEEWVSFGDENGGGAFSQLEELYIEECPKLTGGLPVHLSSLSKLKITYCPQLVAPLPLTPTIRELELRNCDEMQLTELPTGMQKLALSGFSLTEGMIDSGCGLQALHLHGCWLKSLCLPSTLKTLRIVSSSLVSLLEDSNSCLEDLEVSCCHTLKGVPSTLKTLHIYNCMMLEFPTHMYYLSLEILSLDRCRLKSFPLDLFPKLFRIQFRWCDSLESLTVPENCEHDLVTLLIQDCLNFVSFPKGGLHAPSLTSLSVIDCPSLRLLPNKMHLLLPSLEVLLVSKCPKVESLPEGGLPSNLKSIEIDRCDKLIASRMGWGLQNLPFLSHFKIMGEYEDVESLEAAQLLPTSLTSLSISRFPNLKCLDKKGLKLLYALKELDISNCPKLKCMPEQGLPASLSILRVEDCPLLQKEWQSKKGKEWRKIAHVEQKWIDCELIE